MAKKTEKIQIEVPTKAICISHARCPKGCDLMDETVKIGGHPSIKVKQRYEGREGTMNLDPVYGSFEHQSSLDIPKGAVVEFFCPGCGASLQSETDTCNVCASPMFTLHLPKGSIIEGCLRNGCFEHTLKIVNPEDLFKRLYDDGMLDAFL